MNRIHIVGRSNHGKTKLIVDLVGELGRRGLRVGTIKHTHHRHELDVPGKDSHRHRQAGAKAVGILSQSLGALFIPLDVVQSNEDRYSLLAPAFAGCDMVLVEGDVQADAPKVEVWRASVGTRPMAADIDSILAVVSDDPFALPVPRLPRSDLMRIADWLLELADCGVS